MQPTRYVTALLKNFNSCYNCAHIQRVKDVKEVIVMKKSNVIRLTKAALLLAIFFSTSYAAYAQLDPCENTIMNNYWVSQAGQYALCSTNTIPWWGSQSSGEYFSLKKQSCTNGIYQATGTSSQSTTPLNLSGSLDSTGSLKLTATYVDASGKKVQNISTYVFNDPDPSVCRYGYRG